MKLHAVRDDHGLWISTSWPWASDVGEVAWFDEPEWLSMALAMYAEGGLHRKTLPSKVFGTPVAARFGIDDRLLIDVAVWPRRSNAVAAADASEKVGLPRPPVIEGRVSWQKV